MTTPSTPTSTMKEAERLVREFSTAATDYGDESRYGVSLTASAAFNAAEAALLAFIRSLVEAQPSAVDHYAIALQRAIEAHCRGERIPADVAAYCQHHADKLDATLPSAVAGEAAMVDGYLGSAMLSSSDAHKIVVSYATREQADKAHEWLSAQVDAAPSAVLPLKGEVPTPARDVLPAKCAGCERRCSGCPVSHPDSTMKG